MGTRHARTRVTLTNSELRSQQEECLEAFLAAGINPYLTYRIANGTQITKKLRLRLFTSDNGKHGSRYLVARDWVSLPSSDAKKGKKIAVQLRRCTAELYGNMWTGVITAGQRCTVNFVRSRSRLLMNTARKFFADQKRFNGVNLIFGAIQTPVRTRSTGKLRKNPNGQLLYHVHLHLMFTMATSRRQQQRALSALRDKFGDKFERVKDRHALITYLTAPQDRSDILSCGEFVRWHEQVQRFPRMRLYGSFRIKPANRSGYPRPTGISRHYRKNQFLTRLKFGGKHCVIWENPHGDFRTIYERENVDRIPDDT
jgi:hypothetical protein